MARKQGPNLINFIEKPGTDVHFLTITFDPNTKINPRPILWMVWFKSQIEHGISYSIQFDFTHKLKTSQTLAGCYY